MFYGHMSADISLYANLFALCARCVYSIYRSHETCQMINCVCESATFVFECLFLFYYFNMVCHKI